jgi:hypothetical protein
VPGVRPDAQVVRSGADAGASPAARPARIQVTVLPFCDLEIDGRPAGRSPMPAPVELPAGPHRIRCKHPTSGQVWERSVTLKPGELLPLRGSVFPETRVTIRLGRGDRLVVGTVPHGPGAVSIAAGRYPYRLMRREELVERGWLTIPPGACTLSDAPKVECR